MNVAGFLHASAARHAGRPAVTDVRSGRTLGYGELAAEAERVEAFLGAQGVERGQRIGLLAPNTPAYLAAAFGLLATGACLVPIAPHLTRPEVQDLLREVHVNGCLAWPGEDSLPAGSAERVLAGGACDAFAFRWIRREAEGPAGFDGLEPAFIRFTSGTTALSKGVVLSHRATWARVEAADRVLGLTETDRIAWVLPLAYHFAVTLVAYVRAGAHVLLCPDALPSAVIDAIDRFRATVLYASPLHFERLSSQKAAPLSSLRIALSTSAPIAAATIDRFEAASGVPLGQAYGIIEAGLPCINTRADGLAATSVGRPTPGYEVAVLSPGGERLERAVSGDIGLRGPGLFSAYYRPWQLRERVMRGGWFMTGDVGRFDGDGALHLEGRTKAVIFVAGLKFFPEEVEACIDRFPGVRESRVTGHPHARLGQVPRAEVVPSGAAADLDLDALRAHCARALSSHKVPIDFTLVAAIPRTAGGKILRR